MRSKAPYKACTCLQNDFRDMYLCFQVLCPSFMNNESFMILMIENYTCAFELSSHSLVLVTSQNVFRIYDHFGSFIHSGWNTIVSYLKSLEDTFPIPIFRIQGNKATWIELKVFNLNTWGISWFDDEPIVSLEEPYNISSVAETDIKVSNLLFFTIALK